MFDLFERWLKPAVFRVEKALPSTSQLALTADTLNRANLGHTGACLDTDSQLSATFGAQVDLSYLESLYLVLTFLHFAQGPREHQICRDQPRAYRFPDRYFLPYARTPSHKMFPMGGTRHAWKTLCVSLPSPTSPLTDETEQ